MPASGGESAPATPSSRRSSDFAVIILCLLPLAAITLWLIARCPGPYRDFTAYWGAARVFLAHQNPYAQQPLFDIQRSIGWPEPGAIRAYNPPWSLPLFAPIGLVPFAPAQIFWLILSLAIEAFAALAMWSYFGGAPRLRWIALVVALTFVPLGETDRLGQITPLILLGLVAFLLLVRAQRWFLAGLLLLPALGLKPHITWLVTLAVLLWCVQQRRWRLLFGAFAALAASTGVVAFFDPAAFHYFGNIYGQAIDQVCGLGGGLRILFGVQHTWLQYAPCIPGLAWLLWYWARHRHAWNWPEHTPLLLLVSLVTSPYAWHLDSIVALPAFIALAARGAWRSPLAVIGWLIVQAAIFASPSHGIDALASALWIPFFLLANRTRADSDHPQQEAAQDRTASTLDAHPAVR
jgi:Glycosyltransferase family 87